MRGVISALAPDGTYGQIAADDGQRYSYWTSELRNGPARVNDAVNFQMADGQPVDIFILPKPGQGDARPGAPRQSPVPGAARATMSTGGYAAAVPAGYAAPATYAVAGEAIPSDKNYWITLFTTPSGRISRRQFWLHGVLPLIGASILLGWIPIIGQLISLALLWAGICLAFKRFHDLGYPGWYSLVYLVPMIAAGILVGLSFYLFGFAHVFWLLAEILWAVGALIGLAQLIFVYVRVGEEGPNKYGPDPLAGA